MQAGLGLTRNRHGNQFHTRICIPKDLAPQLGRREIRISLGTEQRRYAIRAARLIHARKITAFDQLRAVMDKNKTPTPEQQAENRKHVLAAIQQYQQAKAYPDPNEAAESVQEVERYAQEADLNAQQDAQIVALDELAEVVRASEFVQAKRLHEIMGSTDPGLDAFKFTTTQQSAVAEVAQLRADLARASRETQLKEHELTQTKGMLQDALKRGVGQPDELPGELPEVRFSEVIAAYQESLEPTKRVARTNQQYVSETRRFIQAMGDMFIKDISGQTMRAFFDIEKELPPNINKVKRYEGLTWQEVSKINADEDGETVELSTAVQRVTRINTLFRWALKRDDASKWGFPRGKNPCEDFKNKYLTADEEREIDDAEHTRRAFSNEDLRRLFTGKMEEGGGRRVFGYGYGARCFKRRYQYWLPLLALFTGARANELAQLRLSDIQGRSETPYFDFNEAVDEDGVRRKSLKTKTSKRHVPIHPKLIELGFLDYVNELEKNGHWCLFQEMNPEEAKVDKDTLRTTYGSQMTNWFFKYRKACGVLKNPEGKPVFHSFRHTAATRLENGDVPMHRFSGILGHLQDGETMRTYATLDKAKLRAELEKMEFPADVMDSLPHWRDIKFQDRGKPCPMPKPAKLEAPVKL